MNSARGYNGDRLFVIVFQRARMAIKPEAACWKTTFSPIDPLIRRIDISSSLLMMKP
jgi:hypothetical protein